MDVCTCVSNPSTQVQSDQYIPVEDIHGEMGQLEKQLDELEQRGVELEKKLRDNPNGNMSHLTENGCYGLNSSLKYRIIKINHNRNIINIFVFSDEDEEHLLVDWFTLIHEKHLLVRREAELVYT